MGLPLTRDIAQTMSLCILPGIKTVLHCITADYEFLKYFLDYAMQSEKDAGDSCEQFPIPFIEDINGETPLHCSMSQKNTEIVSKEDQLAKINQHREEKGD